MWNILFAVQLASSLTPQTWIGDSLGTIGNLTLKNITLPGTHDSGTYYLTDIPMPGDQPLIWEALFKLAELLNEDVAVVAKKWAQSQDKTFYQQMQGGIRYFDLRSGWNRTTKQWVTFHFLEGTMVRYLLQNITQYLIDYPKEIVVVEMSHFDGNPTKNDITELSNMVQDILGPYLYPVDYSLNFTINQMVSSGKRALVTMESGFDNITIWSGDAIHNTYADTADLTEMIAYNNKTVQAFMNSSHPNQYFKISWTLTPDSTVILDSIEPWKPQNLIALADTANKALPSFYNSISKNGWRMGNILIIDHFEKSQIMTVVWAMNGLGVSLKTE